MRHQRRAGVVELLGRGRGLVQEAGPEGVEGRRRLEVVLAQRRLADLEGPPQVDGRLVPPPRPFEDLRRGRMLGRHKNGTFKGV